MDLDEIKCTLCGKFYDEDAHNPILLPDCGHSYCVSCVKTSIAGEEKEAKGPLVCPEDG